MSFFDFTDPNSNGQLLGLLSGLGQAAMPSRLPVPFGAVLGQAASGMMAGQQQNLANQKSGLELKTGNLGYAQLLNQLDAQMKLAGHPEGIGFLGNLGGASLPSPGPSQPPPGAPPMGTRMDVLNAAGGGDIAAGAANLGTQPAANNPALQSLAPPSLVGGNGRVAGGLPPGISPQVWDAMSAADRSSALAKWVEPADLRENQGRYAYGQTVPVVKNIKTPEQIAQDAADAKAVAEGRLPSELTLKQTPLTPAQLQQQIDLRKASQVLTPEAVDQRVDLARRTSIARGEGVSDVSDPAVQAHIHAVTNGTETMQQVPSAYRNAVAQGLDNLPQTAYTPQTGARYAMESQRIRSAFLDNPGYKMVANGMPYLQRIDAALKVPGPVADQDLLDSLTKLNTAGNAVTDAQVRLITDGKSYSDWLHVLGQRFGTGGVLSPAMRQQIHDVANEIFTNYKKGYAPVYQQLTTNLRSAQIPQAFWGVPDLERISQESGFGAISPSAGGQPGANNPPPQTYPAPSPAAVQRLKMMKDNATFDAIFGPGAAAKALGAGNGR